MELNERIERALEVAVQHAGAKSEGRKAWVIDQMTRWLTDCPIVLKEALDAEDKPYAYEALGVSEEYQETVAQADVSGYGWSEGVRP